MEQLVDLYKKSEHLHHAYFLVGDTNTIFERLKDFLEKNVGMKISGNPDFWSGKFNTLTIDEARAITELQERVAFTKGFGQSRKFFIIQADFITEEAQNSLLKVFKFGDRLM